MSTGYLFCFCLFRQKNCIIFLTKWRSLLGECTGYRLFFIGYVFGYVSEKSRPQTMPTPFISTHWAIHHFCYCRIRAPSRLVLAIGGFSFVTKKAVDNSLSTASDYIYHYSTFYNKIAPSLPRTGYLSSWLLRCDLISCIVCIIASLSLGNIPCIGIILDGCSPK